MKKDHGNRSCSKQEQSKGFFFIQLFSKYKERKCNCNKHTQLIYRCYYTGRSKLQCMVIAKPGCSGGKP